MCVEAARRLNYRPNYFARSLRQSRSMSVGVLAPDLSEGYFTRVMSGVVSGAEGGALFLLHRLPRLERGTDRDLPADAGGAGGGRVPAAEHTGRPIAVPVPVVAISAHSAADNVTNIVVDHHRAVHQALTHLWELGHRRVAIMRGPARFPTPECAGRVSSRWRRRSA